VTALTRTAAVWTWAANLLVSVGDKLISGFVALVAVSALPAGLRRLEVPLLPPPGPPRAGRPPTG
jgi:energy-coupling factor transport system substrate-specific component